MRCFPGQHGTLAAIAAALLLLLPAGLQAKPHAKHAARDQILAIENQWVKAQLQGDVAAMDKLLSPDFLGIITTGEVVTKSQQLDRMRNRELVLKALDISDVRVKLIGLHAASVTSLAKVDGASGGHPLVGSFRYTHVYERLPNGLWVITNFEATRIPGSGRRPVEDGTPAADGASVPHL